METFRLGHLLAYQRGIVKETSEQEIDQNLSHPLQSTSQQDGTFPPLSYLSKHSLAYASKEKGQLVRCYSLRTEQRRTHSTLQWVRYWM